MTSPSNADERFFTRSAYGLSNYHIFSRTDITVFIEGACKNGLTIGECLAENYSNNLGYNDKLFWNSFFINFCQKKNFEIRVVGSKAFLKKIFDEINLQKEFPNTVIICIDRDNKFIDDFPKHESIFTTYGYSWENEIWNKENTIEVICSLLPLSRKSQGILRKELSQWYDDFFSNLSRFIFLDTAYTCNSDGLFFRSEDVGHNIIVNNAAKSIQIDKLRLRARWLEKRRSRRAQFRRIKGNEIEKYWDCYGHLIDSFFRQKTRFLGEKHSCPNLEPKAIIPLLISNFWKKIQDPKNDFLLAHYHSQWKQFCTKKCINCSEVAE